MKHARKALVLMILLVTPLLLSGVISPATNDEVKTTLTQTPTKVSLPSYEIVTAIIAYNDFDMDNYASALSWEGNGDPDTPYIIEGYNITTDGDCIEIQDTTRAFEIRNCYLSSVSGNDGTGIVINNATQVAIEDTIIENKDDAIITQNIPSPIFRNITIHVCVTGIDMAACPGATIVDCYFDDNFDFAIRFIASNDTLIMDNEIDDTVVGSGIEFHLSHNVQVVNNHISHCEASGVRVYNSPYAIIENNRIHDNDFFTGVMCGIRLENADHTSIIGNEIYDNSRNGIFVINSDWVYIFDNEIYGNSDHGIDTLFSANGTILQNDIHGNGWWPAIMNELCGIHLALSIDWVISDNSIWNNTPSGISLAGAQRIEISNNHIFNNTDTGIYANHGDPVFELDILDNEIHHNGLLATGPEPAGILTYGYQECLIEGNYVYNNTNYGISINGDNNRIIGNIVHDSETGIGTEECYNNLVSENTVFNCLGGILVVNVGTNVTYNIVYDNEYGIYMQWSGFCLIYGNDMGWNDVNAHESYTFPGEPLLWDDNVSIGNHYHDYDGSGTYDVWNSTDVSNFDRFPSISLNLSQAGAVSFEILETGNLIEWEAYALNPSHYEVFVDSENVLVEEWDGGNIEFPTDGLAHGTHTIEVQVFHISGHSMGNDTVADVEDLTPPDLDGPSHIVITAGDAVSEQYSATDPSDIGSWAVNDTVNFAIDSSGLLTSITDLSVGEHTIRVTVTDTHGHSTTMDVTVTVSSPPGLPASLALAVGGGAIAVIVVLVVILKKKET